MGQGRRCVAPLSHVWVTEVGNVLRVAMTKVALHEVLDPTYAGRDRTNNAGRKEQRVWHWQETVQRDQHWGGWWVLGTVPGWGNPSSGILGGTVVLGGSEPETT